jgi:hypothetical protein
MDACRNFACLLGKSDCLVDGDTPVLHLFFSTCNSLPCHRCIENLTDPTLSDGSREPVWAILSSGRIVLAAFRLPLKVAGLPFGLQLEQIVNPLGTYLAKAIVDKHGRLLHPREA